MPRLPARQPEPLFPGDALDASVQAQPRVTMFPGTNTLTYSIASAADSISPWGRAPMLRDRQLRDFWPSEPYLAGAIGGACFRNACYRWLIQGPSTAVEVAVTDMLTAAISGDTFGWSPFIVRYSEDMYTQDNGAFIELIRDPGQDANSAFKDERAPVIGIANLDANRCVRTGNIEYPVLYTDNDGKMHKLAWWQVISVSDLPSAISTMNGVGYSAVTRVLRAAQVMRSIMIFKDEKIGGRHYRQIHFVSGVGRQEIKDELRRGQEEADNVGTIRFLAPAILASLDPEKPVSVATIDMASLPDGFNYDEEMKWYITNLALCLGVDYQEIAPLPGGNIGSSNQSSILHRKAAGRGPAMFMKLTEYFRNYGVLPRGYKMVFEDLDEEKELDKQTLRRMFQEEMAMALRNGVITPAAARKIAIERGLYLPSEFDGIPEEYGLDLLRPGTRQNVGQVGGNTIAEDVDRVDTGAQNERTGNRLQKENTDTYLDAFREIEQARKEDRTTLVELFRTLMDFLRLSRKESKTPPPAAPLRDLNIKIDNHPGQPPVIKFNPELKSHMRVVIPRQKMDGSMARAMETVAQAIKERKPDMVKVDVQPAHVVVNTPPSSNPPDESEDVVKAIRNLTRNG